MFGIRHGQFSPCKHWRACAIFQALARCFLISLCLCLCVCLLLVACACGRLPDTMPGCCVTVRGGIRTRHPCRRKWHLHSHHLQLQLHPGVRGHAASSTPGPFLLRPLTTLSPLHSCILFPACVALSATLFLAACLAGVPNVPMGTHRHCCCRGVWHTPVHAFLGALGGAAHTP